MLSEVQIEHRALLKKRGNKNKAACSFFLTVGLRDPIKFVQEALTNILRLLCFL